MKTQIIDLKRAHLAPKKSVLSLGGFDGIHLGHQAVLQRLLLLAKKKKAPACLCLFDPLPFQVLKKHSSFKRLFTIEETQELLQSFSLDFFCVIPFDRSFSKLKPEEFVRSFIMRQFDPIHIVAGYDFSFAHQREGNFSVLKGLADQCGFSAERVSACLYKDRPVSSSRIRQCLSLAQMEDIRALLGRPFSIQAQVVKGEGRGKKLGFPTANLQAPQKELPPFGVYGGKAKIAGSWRKAVVNIGRRPTFPSSNNSRQALIEAHIPSFEHDLYGQDLKIELDFFIRKERAFASASELQKAIERDIKAVLSS